MKRQHVYLLSILVIIVALVGIFFAKNSFTSRSTGVIPLKQVEIADTPSLRERGLSGRSVIADDFGLLFVFEMSGGYEFWMKDMKFPIDIVWLDKNLRVTSVSEDISPQTFPKTFTSSQKSKYVLEVNSKIAKKNNYIEGNTLDFLNAYLHTK